MLSSIAVNTVACQCWDTDVSSGSVAFDRMDLGTTQSGWCIVRCVDIGNLSWLKSSSHSAEAAAAAAGRHGDSDAVVLVDGALVNVSSVLQNLSKSEEERAQMETELKNLEQDCGM